MGLLPRPPNMIHQLLLMTAISVKLMKIIMCCKDQGDDAINNHKFITVLFFL